MLRNFLGLRDLTAADVMIPRADIVSVGMAESFADIIRQISEANHSRVPVRRQTLDEIAGFIHIKDVVRATLQLATEGEPGSTWHLSTKESCSIKELVEQICKLAGANFSELVQSSEERLGKDQSYLLESSAMRQVHGWTDQISQKQGLQETLAWVDANLATLKTQPWSYQHKS